MWVIGPNQELWTGSEETLRHTQALVDRINAIDPKAFFDDDDEDEEPESLLEREGSVGIIPIRGQLFSSVPNWVKAFFGIVDYGDISSALVEAAKDPSIGSILLDVDSPGGAVNGVDNVAALVQRIDSEVKPVHALAGGMMASAAYWIASGARSISSGSLSAVGSIGVLQIHREYSKAEEQEGIKTTVLRAGRYKALGNPYEPLSEQARAEMQSKLDYTYGIFMGHVAQARGLPYDIADAKFGQGRVFLGEMAKEVGLVDELRSYEEALTFAAQEGAKRLDTSKSLISNTTQKKQEGLSMKGKKATLTASDVAALASGAVVAAEPAVAEPDPVTTDAAAPAVAESAPVTTDAAEPAAAEPAAAEPAAAPVQPDQSAAIALLERQLKDAQDALVAEKVAHAATKSTADTASAQLSPLVAIARGAVRNMYIALGAPGAHVDALDTSTLLAEHEKVAETFKDRFKVGGVAAASAQADEKAQKAFEPSAFQKARIQAVRLAS